MVEKLAQSNVFCKILWIKISTCFWHIYIYFFKKIRFKITSLIQQCFDMHLVKFLIGYFMYSMQLLSANSAPGVSRPNTLSLLLGGRYLVPLTLKAPRPIYNCTEAIETRTWMFRLCRNALGMDSSSDTPIYVGGQSKWEDCITCHYKSPIRK